MSDLHPVREFFRSDKMLEFINDHCDGMLPWAAIVDADDRLVVTDHRRDVFYVMRWNEEEAHFDVSTTYDALKVIDPEAELDDHLGHRPTAEAAFEVLKWNAYGLGLPKPENAVFPQP